MRCRWRCKILIYLFVCIREASSTPAIDRFPVTEISECDYVSPSWHVSVQGDHINSFSKKKKQPNNNKKTQNAKQKTNPFIVPFSSRSHRMLPHQICSICCTSPTKSPPALICSVKAKGQVDVPLSPTLLKDSALNWH